MTASPHGAEDGGAAKNARQPFHWRTAISWKTADRIVCRGYDINHLADQVSFPDMIFLLFQGRLPAPAEARMLQHIMVVFSEHAFSPSTVAARMAAVGRPALNAAIAAGILTFGEAHGPGLDYGKMMTGCLAAARAAGRSPAEAAGRLVDGYLAEGRMIPGIHQPQHTGGDPRAGAIFAKARDLGVAGDYVTLQFAIADELARRKGGLLRPNLLAAAGSVQLDLGFGYEAAFAIGILCRAFGCAAHAIEEMDRESPWRAFRGPDMVDLLDLSLQGPEHYDGPAERPVPPPEGRPPLRST